MAYDGYIHNGSAWVRLTENNAKHHNGSAWAGMQQCNAYLDGAWRDILYHPPTYPPPGTRMWAEESLRTKHYSVGTAGFSVRNLIVGEGYTVEAAASSPGSCKFYFRRSSSENTSFWFNIALYRNGSAVATAGYVGAGAEFGLTIPCGLLDGQFSLAWTGAPPGAGNNGREFNCTWRGIEFL